MQRQCKTRLPYNLQKLKNLIASEYEQWYQIVKSYISRFLCQVVISTTTIILYTIASYWNTGVQLTA